MFWRRCLSYPFLRDMTSGSHLFYGASRIASTGGRSVGRSSVVRGPPPPPHRRFQAFLAKGVAAVAVVAAAISADTLPIYLSSRASPLFNAVALFPSGCIYGFCFLSEEGFHAFPRQYSQICFKWQNAQLYISRDRVNEPFKSFITGEHVEHLLIASTIAWGNFGAIQVFVKVKLNLRLTPNPTFSSMKMTTIAASRNSTSDFWHLPSPPLSPLPVTLDAPVEKLLGGRGGRVAVR